MGKYEPLARYLKSRADDSWNASFAQIEDKLGFPLPRSAREHRAWWSNQKNGHSQTAGWRDAGWATCEVDLRRGLVQFGRIEAMRPHRLAQNGKSERDKADLWRQAGELSGIRDREKLIEAALTALIRQETSRYFAHVGGTMGEADAAPRERPFG